MKNLILVLAFTLLGQTFAHAGQTRSFLEWCNDISQRLERVQRDATFLYSSGQHEQAVAKLHNGLVSAAGTQQDDVSSITYKSLTRGIELSELLQVHIDGSSKQNRQIALFLDKYYDFVQNVIRDLDSRFYSYNCRYCKKNIEDLERLYVQFSYRQTKLILDEFAITTPALIYPKGSSELLLKALEVSSHYSAIDLADSMFAELYACNINALEDVNLMLDEHNNTNTPIYSNKQMVQIAYHDATSAIQNTCAPIRPKFSFGNGHSYKSKSNTIYSGRMTVSLKNPKTLSLRHPRYIKKLVISAEGVRRDAKFNVVVNGDIKGTIYVPGRDPSYYVTIEDYVESIQFISEFGKARIFNITILQ